MRLKKHEIYLLVVWVMVGLSLVCLFMYRNCLTYGYRSFYTQAKTQLGSIHEMQSEYRKKKGAYAQDLSYLDFNNSSKVYAIIFNGKYYEPVSSTGRARELPAGYNTCFDDEYYNAFAVSNLDGDDFTNIWMIDPMGDPVHVQSDYNNKVEHMPRECQ